MFIVRRTLGGALAVSLLAGACAAGGGNGPGADGREVVDAEDVGGDAEADGLPDGDGGGDGEGITAEDGAEAGGDAEAGPETGDDADGETDGADADGEDGSDAGRTLPALISSTSGGGEISSPNYRARISIGTPQPMGAGSSASYQGRFGAGAVLVR
jgi:hypothetical protein